MTQIIGTAVVTPPELAIRAEVAMEAGGSRPARRAPRRRLGHRWQRPPATGAMCLETLLCGPIGNGLLMKLAVNLYLDTMIVALADAFHFADHHRLDLH